MQTTKHDLIKSIASRIDYSVLIPVIEDLITMEYTNSEANKLLHNIDGYLANQYRITHAEILLSLLRRGADLA
jgi:hypothetical protein